MTTKHGGQHLERPLWSRREVLKTAGGAMVGGLASLAVPGIVRAQSQSGPLRLGIVFAKQGVWTEQSKQLADGVTLALKRKGNQILGRDIELLWYDEPNPQGAQQNISKLMYQDKVFAVVGGSNSGTALAMSSVAARAQIPYLCPGAAAAALTGSDCNPYTFRTLTTTMVASRALAPACLEIGKNWYYLAANYAYGQDIYNSMSGLLKQAGGKELGYDKAPLGTSDYSSFILKIRQAKPDVVMLGLPGGDLSTFLKQWADMGMKGKIPVACPIIGNIDLWSVGAEAATGYYGMPWSFSNPQNPQVEKEFAAEYAKMHPGQAPCADKVWLGWYTTRVLLEAVEKAQSVEAGKIVKSLETTRINDGAYDAGYRSWDHQMLHPCMVFKVKDKITDKWDWLDAVAQEPKQPSWENLNALFGTEQEIGCKMPPH
ncbi:ABC transporter substrate-binding protein [Castellaniella sp.]|uniref:ABC transporter substrate-binding protein n=1 Tax=Castellaniella sp. TaxID=1955812 RepID=UPI003C77D800